MTTKYVIDVDMSGLRKHIEEVGKEIKDHMNKAKAKYDELKSLNKDLIKFKALN